MIKFNNITLFLLVNLSFYAQNNKTVKKLVLNYPNFSSIEEVGLKIKNDFKSDYSRAKAIYFWVAYNYSYYKYHPILVKEPTTIVYFDKDDLNRREENLRTELVKKSFINKEGVCESFAYTFSHLCSYLGIENETIEGIVKNEPENIGNIPKLKNHVWNAFKVDNRWIFLDVTFGSEKVYKNNKWVKDVDFFYFDIAKYKINKTHYPAKNIWVEILKISNFNSFIESPNFYKSFLQSSTILIRPTKGTIKINKKANYIVIKFKNLNNYNVSYSFGKNKFAKKPIITNSKLDEKHVYVEIPKKNNYLNIFFKNKLALQYKVILE